MRLKISERAFAERRRLHFIPIDDLCHFGFSDWIGNFQTPELPRSSRSLRPRSPTGLGAEKIRLTTVRTAEEVAEVIVLFAADVARSVQGAVVRAGGGHSSRL